MELSSPGEGAPGIENPILYVEELRRFPLLPRRIASPGTQIVYRDASGRLVTFANELTAGEAFFIGVRVMYEVDVTKHPFQAEIRVGFADEHVSVAVTGSWSVVDPVAVVANRVTYVPQTCTAELRSLLNQLADATNATTLEGFRIGVAAGLPRSVHVASSILLNEIAANVRPLPAVQRVSATAFNLISELLLHDDAESTSVEAVADAWQEARDIADAAKRASALGRSERSQEDEQALQLAVTRYSQMIVALQRQLDGVPDVRPADA